MKAWSVILAAALWVLAACGDKKESAEREQEAQRAIQQGLQKEKALMEGMIKGVESVEKKMSERKDEPKR